MSLGNYVRAMSSGRPRRNIGGVNLLPPLSSSFLHPQKYTKPHHRQPLPISILLCTFLLYCKPLRLPTKPRGTRKRLSMVVLALELHYSLVRAISFIFVHHPPGSLGLNHHLGTRLPFYTCTASSRCLQQDLGTCLLSLMWPPKSRLSSSPLKEGSICGPLPATTVAGFDRLSSPQCLPPTCSNLLHLSLLLRGNSISSTTTFPVPRWLSLPHCTGFWSC
jgi:hypothetical protein